MADDPTSLDIDKGLEGVLFKLWSVVDDLSRLHPRDETYYRVTIFGSSRARPGDAIYDEVRTLAAELARRGCDIVTGGGPGLMQAANEGEREGDPENRTRSIGVALELPFEDGANPFVERAYTHATFFSRLHHFVRLSDAFVAVGGGIGTTLESLMIWQLIQVGHLEDRPLIFLGNMWRDLVSWGQSHMLNDDLAFASARDFEIPHCVTSVNEALAIIEEHRRRTGRLP